MLQEKINRVLQFVDTAVELLLAGAIVVLVAMLTVTLLEQRGVPGIATILGLA